MEASLLPVAERPQLPSGREVAARRALARAALVVAVLAGIVAIRALSLGDHFELPAGVQDGVTLSLAVFVESLPFVILGTLISIFVQFWLPPSWFERLLPSRPVFRRAALSVLGVVLPVCECGNVPLARGLLARGFSPAESITFLLAAPVLNPVTILTTYHAFGWDSGILIARILGGFAIANLLGWWLSGHPRPQTLLTPSFRASCEHQHAETGGRLERSAAAFRSEMGMLLPALAIGSAIAGAIQVGVPRGVLVALGGHPLWSVLALLCLAFVISICSNVDAFFVLSLSASFLPGSIVAFLLFGAMTDVKMVALLRTTFTTKLIVLLVALTAGLSAIIGWGLNLVA